MSLFKGVFDRFLERSTGGPSTSLTVGWASTHSTLLKRYKECTSNVRVLVYVRRKEPMFAEKPAIYCLNPQGQSWPVLRQISFKRQMPYRPFTIQV